MYVIKTITKKDQPALFIRLHYRLQFLFFINFARKRTSRSFLYSIFFLRVISVLYVYKYTYYIYFTRVCTYIDACIGRKIERKMQDLLFFSTALINNVSGSFA